MIALQPIRPYENVIKNDYPPILITGGLTDPRVTYWEPAKWAAILRENQKGNSPILLKINMDSGTSRPTRKIRFAKRGFARICLYNFYFIEL